MMSWIKSLFGKAKPQKVLVNPSGLQLLVAPGETILEQALQVSSPYPHDCTFGTCGTCRTNLISSKVDAIKPFSYALSREELEAVCVFACQAVPKNRIGRRSRIAAAVRRACYRDGQACRDNTANARCYAGGLGN
jgi:p-cymene monooxygenase electron transfer component